MSDLNSIEGLSRIAREQIRDRQRIRTLEVHMSYSSQMEATVLVEEHFKRLVMTGEGVHSSTQNTRYDWSQFSELIGN